MERLIFFLWREAADVAGMKEGRDGWRCGREEGREWKGGEGIEQAWGLAASGIIRPPAFCVKTGALEYTVTHGHRAQTNQPE